MEETARMIRAVSEDTERPYYTINYRLPVSENNLVTIPADSVADYQDNRYAHGRVNRSQSESVPLEFGECQLRKIEESMPGTPRTQYRRSYQTGFDPLHQKYNTTIPSDDQQHQEPSGYDTRRSHSVTDLSAMELHRAAPSIPIDRLQNGAAGSQTNNPYANHSKQQPNQKTSAQNGLVTCLNSKNVAKYRIGQPYRRGVIIGIDEEQGKIIVFHAEMPPGVLNVLRTKNGSRYEKGYPVIDVQGHELGIVHAIDRKQNILVINTMANEGSSPTIPTTAPSAGQYNFGNGNSTYNTPPPIGFSGVVQHVR